MMLDGKATGRSSAARFTTPMVLMSERPAKVEDRTVAGDGDLTDGKDRESAIATCWSAPPATSTRAPDGQSVRRAVLRAPASTVQTRLGQPMRSLTWGKGSGTGRRCKFALTSDKILVSSCDRASRWWLGSNNTNGCLCQCFPKATEQPPAQPRRPGRRRRPAQRTPTQNARLGKPSRAPAMNCSLPDQHNHVLQRP
ncbi:hypothetical protein GCM10017562_66530 [Streptomyces roseofulvus]